MPTFKCSKTDDAVRLAGADVSSWLSWSCYGAGVFAIARLDPQVFFHDPVGVAALGTALFIFFTSVVLLQRALHQSLQEAAYRAPTQLVTSGAYRYSRNPIYAAFLIPLASLGYYSIMIAAIATSVYIITMNVIVIRREEARLSEVFGESYRSYCARAPRWFGPL